MAQFRHDEMQEIMDECFNGRVVRECNICPANEEHGGRCCFGDKHQWGDRECRECIHQDDCAPLSHGALPRSAKPRIMLKSGRTSNVRPLSQFKNEGGSIVKPLVIRRSPTHRTPDGKPQEETMLKRLGKFTLWGMIEGGLQMALNFFQGNRPE